jgi:hypothetical protein
MQDAVLFGKVAEVYNHRIVLPFLKMKTCVGGKIALRVIGEAKNGGSSSTSSRVEGALGEAISPRGASVSSGGSERHLLCRVVGRRRSIGAAQLQSLESFNTLMEYVFQGAKAAAETQLAREAGGPSSPTLIKGNASDRRMLLEEDKLEVEAAVAFGSVPLLDCSGHVPSVTVQQHPAL